MRMPKDDESKAIDRVLSNPSTDLIDAQREILLSRNKAETSLAVQRFTQLAHSAVCLALKVRV